MNTTTLFRPPRRAARRRLGVALLIAAAAGGAGAQSAGAAAEAAPAAAPVDAAPMLRCRTIAESAARLACYDAIVLPGLGSRAGWGSPVAPAAAAAPVGSAPGSAAERFGMESRDSRSMPERLESRLAETIEGWEPDTRFRFENGQVWQVVDGSRAYYGKLERPRVAVSRGMLGSFYLQIEGVNQAPRVRRVQ